MGMSSYIQAFIPDTDATYQKHKKILLVCEEAGVQLPKETAEYFGTTDAAKYVLEEKLSVELKKGVHYAEYLEDMTQGFEVDLTKLPQGVTKLRFCK